MERAPFDRSGTPRTEPSDAGGAGDAVQLSDRIANELELLARNVDILDRLSGKPPMGIIRLSEALKLPIHKVRYSLHLLEREGVIQPSADGAVVTDRAREYWESLDKSLDRMNEIIRHLKERGAEYRERSGQRKGY